MCRRANCKIYITGAMEDADLAKRARRTLIKIGHSVFVPGRLLLRDETEFPGLEADRDRRWIEAADLVLRLDHRDNASTLDEYYAFDCDKPVHDAREYVFGE